MLGVSLEPGWVEILPAAKERAPRTWQAPCGGLPGRSPQLGGAAGEAEVEKEGKRPSRDLNPGPHGVKHCNSMTPRRT